MKKIIVILLVILPLVAEAQPLRFSLLADPQISWMTANSKDIKTKGAILGINAGLGMDYYFAENYAFSTGLTINNTGGRLQYPDTIRLNVNSGIALVSPGNTITYKLQYISIPIGLKFKTHEIGYTTYFANIGFNPMINIRAVASDKSGYIDKEAVEDVIMLFDANYFITLGVQYSLGGSAAIIGGLGYSSGFVDVTSRASDHISTKAVTLKAGILF